MRDVLGFVCYGLLLSVECKFHMVFAVLFALVLIIVPAHCM